MSLFTQYCHLSFDLPLYLLLPGCQEAAALKKRKETNLELLTLYFQSNVILLLDTTGQALRRLVLPSEESPSKKPSWWNKEETVSYTQLAQQIAKDFWSFLP